MVGISIEVLLCVNLFAINVVGDGTITVPFNKNIKKGKATVNINFHSKFDKIGLIIEVLPEDFQFLTSMGPNDKNMSLTNLFQSLGFNVAESNVEWCCHWCQSSLEAVKESLNLSWTLLIYISWLHWLEVPMDKKPWKKGKDVKVQMPHIWWGNWMGRIMSLLARP